MVTEALPSGHGPARWVETSGSTGKPVRAGRTGGRMTAEDHHIQDALELFVPAHLQYLAEQRGVAQSQTSAEQLAAVDAYLADRNHTRVTIRDNTRAAVYLLIDCSASMAFGSAGRMNKFRYGQILAASLAYLASHQHDAVGTLMFSDTVRDFRPPSSRSGQLHAVLHLIDKAQAESRTDLAAPFSRFRQHVQRRGMVAVISDFYCNPQTMLEAVRPLAFQGQDVILFHLLDPQELDPQFDESTLLEDMETGQTVEVSPHEMRELYPARMQAHIQSLREAATNAGADYVLLNTSESLDVPLRNYFHFRQKRR